jgi:hypothetical protein
MNKFLANVLDAHGGINLWQSYKKVDATIVTGGGLFALKGVLQDPDPRRMTVWLHEERSSVLPYGNTPWDSLHRAYFNGEALWTYLTTPFLLAMEGVRVEETDPWREGDETWRVLRAYFPGSIETHNLVQDFFFGEDLMLRRHDYSVNIAGGFAAAQLTSEYVAANGISLPTKRRAYPRGPDRRPIFELLMVSIDLSEVRFE